MFKRIRFAFVYALRSLRRDKQRTLFAIFSIAVGVATVVALRMLGLMLTDALTENVRALVRGDMAVQARASGVNISFIPQGNSSNRRPFDANNIPTIERWAAAHNAEVTFMTSGELTQAAMVRNEKAGSPAFIQAYFIDPQVYPFYDVIRSSAPQGILLKDLLTGPDQVVVSQRFADELEIKVGDTIRIGTMKNLQTVTGIVPDTSESNVNNPLSIVFGFAYMDRAYSEQFGISNQASDRAFLRFQQPPTTLEAFTSLEDQIRVQWGTSARLIVSNTVEVLARNQFAADIVSRFVLALSLIALVIGGVGIINTMLVSVNRRAPEIAVLKTIGVKSANVRDVFLSEAILLGIFGGLVGAVLGYILSIIARNFGQQTFNFALPWRFHIEPAILGLAMGLVITIMFSILPTMMGASIRPAQVLRQGNVGLARAGLFPSLLNLVVLIVGLGLMIDLIIGNPASLLENVPNMRGVQRAGDEIVMPVIQQLPVSPGILTVLIAFLVFLVVALILWILVWLLGKLPSLRNPNLRLAIRGLTLQRGRTTLSLMALLVGMTSLSSTLILSRSVNDLLYMTLSGPLGGNVVVLPLLPLTSGIVQTQLNSLKNINGFRDVQPASADLRAIDGKAFNYSALNAIAANEVEAGFSLARVETLIGIEVYRTPERLPLHAGRYLTEADRGQPVMTMTYDPLLEQLGIALGSKLTYSVNGRRLTLEVVGLVEPDPRTGSLPFSLGDAAAQTSLETIGSSTMPFSLFIADVQSAYIKDVMASLGAVPGVFVFDVSVFDTLINRILSRMSAIPLLIAMLSLFAATTLIATTVSLATLERRRQIGILKAVGVKRGQVLGQLLTENALIGLAGGLLSILPTLLILRLIPLLTEGFLQLPTPWGLIGLMLLLSVGVTLFATLLTAWSAANEKPLTVLRYE